MKDFNIKCNNFNEIKFIEKYLLNKGFNWNTLYNHKIENIVFKYPIVMYNILDDIYYFNYTDYYPLKKPFIEANHIMRKEKLKRIQ